LRPEYGVGNNWEIVLIALVAIFLVLRLRSVLGRRTGNERPPGRDPFQPPQPPNEQGQPGWRQQPGRPADAPSAGGTVVDLPRPERPTPMPASGPLTVAPAAAAGVAAIQRADGSFEPVGFLQGARDAFEMIVGAFARGDAAALRPLLDDELYGSFENVIRERQAARETQQTTIIGFEACELSDAQLRDRQAICTVRFVTEQINVTRNAEGTIIDGNASEVSKVTDVWTFRRDTGSPDPNWLLVATSSD
jgi:predicted lipid-binding transport protein (Tim44 family)